MTIFKRGAMHYLILIALVAFLGGAHAEQMALRCTPTYLSGAVSKDPIVEIDVSIAADGWHVVHLTQGGAQYWRERQYDLKDYSTGDSHSWSGTLFSHPNISMSGIVHASGGRFDYVETIYDSNRGNALIGSTKAACVTGGPNAAARIADAPSASVDPDFQTARPVRIALELQGGTFTVPVQINGAITLKFLVDSGASDVAIPADVASTLLRTGTITNEDFIGNQQYTLADGRTVPSLTFRIKTLRIGDRVISDVTGSLSPSAGGLLLGQSFLRHFRSWTMDNVTQQLILN